MAPRRGLPGVGRCSRGTVRWPACGLRSGPVTTWGDIPPRRARLRRCAAGIPARRAQARTGPTCPRSRYPIGPTSCTRCCRPCPWTSGLPAGTTRRWGIPCRRQPSLIARRMCPILMACVEHPVAEGATCTTGSRTVTTGRWAAPRAHPPSRRRPPRLPCRLRGPQPALHRRPWRGRRAASPRPHPGRTKSFPSIPGCSSSHRPARSPRSFPSMPGRSRQLAARSMPAPPRKGRSRSKHRQPPTSGRSLRPRRPHRDRKKYGSISARPSAP